MGDSDFTKSPKSGIVITGKNPYHNSLIASRKPLVLLIRDTFGNGAVGNITLFLLKVAALELVRRFSKKRCPCVWQGLQALQIISYPPFKWIQRWAPFKGLIKCMQVLSRPMLALSIATVFLEQSECSGGKSDCIRDPHDSVAYSELSPVQVDMDTSQHLTDPELKSENWLTQLHQELENQGMSLPERINDDELHRFYTASNGDFSCFLTSIKKTIRWRETYRILPEVELKMWSKLVFWHGSDIRLRPCLIVRLGLACRTVTSQDRPRFAQAVVSQVEYGVLHLVDDEDNPQITVLVDCEGLSPSIIPMQMMRSCSSILLDHFPDRLGCLFVIRLPAVVHVTAQTFIQILKPATRNKLKIEGEMYQKVLSDNLLILPSYLGGSCTCLKCSKIGNWDMQQLPYATGTSWRDEEGDIISDNEDSPTLHPSGELEGRLYDQLLRTAIISILIFWVLLTLGVVVFDPGDRHLPS